MNKIKLVIAGVAIAVSLVIATVWIVSPYGDNNQNKGPPIAGGDLVLACELPTERPVMSVPSISCPSIQSAGDAKSYAIQYFSQFNDIEFNEMDALTFSGIYNDEVIFVYKSGVIEYSINGDNVQVPIDDFTAEEASSLSVDFISDHGGIGQYTEYKRQTVGPVDDDGNLKGTVVGYSFVYRREYNDYTILGADAHSTIVKSSGQVMYSRPSYTIGAVISSQQVISASDAWANLLISYNIRGDLPDVNITTVDLCYYENEREEPITAMYPAWRFVSENGLELFINALTGDYMN